MRIETERFLLRKLELSDAEGMFQLDSDPEVHKYLGRNPIESREEAIQMIEFIQKQYEDFGTGRVAIINKETKEFIGWTGLKFIKEEVNGLTNFYDLGYRLVRKYWGKGIATETALACLKYAFSELNLDEVYALADSNNIGSNGVLRKVGMQYIEVIEFEGTPHNWYKIKKEHFVL